MDRFLIIGLAGTTSNTSYYSYNDKQPFNGINYYRLKQTDFEGSETGSEIRTIVIKKLNQISIYPNPVVRGHELIINTDQTREYTLKLHDNTSKTIIQSTQLADE